MSDFRLVRPEPTSCATKVTHIGGGITSGSTLVHLLILIITESPSPFCFRSSLKARPLFLSQFLLEKCSLSLASKCIYVGDSPTDGHAATAAGYYCSVGVTWGKWLICCVAWTDAQTFVFIQHYVHVRTCGKKHKRKESSNVNKPWEDKRTISQHIMMCFLLTRTTSFFWGMKDFH